MTESMATWVQLYPSVWSTKTLPVQPGDLARFAPMGRGRIGPVPPDLEEGGPASGDLAAALRLLGVPADATDYAAFVSHAKKPSEERYVTQLRIVRRVALAALYDALTEPELRSFPRQPLMVGELISKFIETEQATWGTGLSPKLRERLGRRNQRFRATLAFGLMVENAFYGVYRVWSRAWLL
jgi:hypothetical protein